MAPVSALGPLKTLHFTVQQPSGSCQPSCWNVHPIQQPNLHVCTIFTPCKEVNHLSGPQSVPLKRKTMGCGQKKGRVPAKRLLEKPPTQLEQTGKATPVALSRILPQNKTTNSEQVVINDFFIQQTPANSSMGEKRLLETNKKM